MKASEVIREMRMQLFQRPWTKGREFGKDGSICMIGALKIAAAEADGLTLAEERRASETIETATEGPMFLFNDARGRTFDEVIEVLDKAEKLALIAEEGA